MKRTTVKIPDDLDAWLRMEAKRRGITFSELVREAIEAHLRPELPRRWLSAGIGDSGRSDISDRMEELLEEILPEQHRRDQADSA